MDMMEGRDDATLFVDKDKWNVKLTLNKQSALTCGWREFREENNLKFGDVCVFVLNKGKETVPFQVVIFSLEKDLKTPYFEGKLYLISVHRKFI
jgi:hypothetical protein